MSHSWKKMNEEEVLRVHQADLTIALARNEAIIPLFASALQAKDVIPEAVKISVSNQHTDATARASSIITSCMSSVKLTPSNFDLIVKALRDVGLRELGNSLVMKVEQDVQYWIWGLDRKILKEFVQAIPLCRLKPIVFCILQKEEMLLRKAFDSSLSDIAKELNKCDIVPHSVIREPTITYDVIMNSFKAGLELTDSVSELESYCSDFLQGLSNVGGPVKKAAIMLERKWIEAVREETGVVLQFQNNQYKPNLAGQTLAPARLI